MKKKIKDFTLGEIKQICKSLETESCKKCPFYNICDRLSLYYATSGDDLESEVEVND